MKLTTLFTFLILALAMNSQAQNVIFSNAPIGEDVKESTQTEFTLGEDEIFQRTHLTDVVTNMYKKGTSLEYFISIDDEVIGRFGTNFNEWDYEMAQKKKTHSSSMISNPEKSARSESAAAQSFLAVISEGGLKPNKSYKIKVEIYIGRNGEVVSEGSFTLKTPNQATLDAFMLPYEQQFLDITFKDHKIPYKALMTDAKIEKRLIKVANEARSLVYDADVTVTKAYIMVTEEEWKGDDGSGYFPVILFGKGTNGNCYRIEANYSAVMKNGKPSKTPVLKSKFGHNVPCAIANKYM
jgi:hypothetical protein